MINIINIFKFQQNIKYIIKLHPSKIKSSYSVISISLISGLEITQLGLPPSYFIFASKSPIVLLTDNLPGNTRWGP